MSCATSNTGFFIKGAKVIDLEQFKEKKAMVYGEGYYLAADANELLDELREAVA